MAESSAGLRFEELSSGQELGRVTTPIDKESVNAWIFCHPQGERLLDFTRQLDGPSAVPPSMVFVLGLRALTDLEIIPPGGILVGHVLRIIQPLEQEQDVVAEIATDRVWNSKERPFVSLKIRIRQKNVVAVEDQMVVMWPTSIPIRLQSLDPIAATSQPDDQIISQEQVNAYARLSGDFNPLHDAVLAKKGPFGEPVVHGVIPAGVLLETVRVWKRDDLRGPPLDFRFTSPLRPSEPFSLRPGLPGEPHDALCIARKREVCSLTIGRSKDDH